MRRFSHIITSCREPLLELFRYVPYNTPKKCLEHSRWVRGNKCLQHLPKSYSFWALMQAVTLYFWPIWLITRENVRFSVYNKIQELREELNYLINQQDASFLPLNNTKHHKIIVLSKVFLEGDTHFSQQETWKKQGFKHSSNRPRNANTLDELCIDIKT